MRIKPFKALYPNLKLVPSPDAFFGGIKQEFPHYLKNSFFKRTREPAFYLYSIKTKHTQSVGLVASTSVEDIIENKVLKHENTLAIKEQQMLDLALQRNAMIKPVLLAHQPVSDLDTIYEEVMKGSKFMNIRFELEKSTHTLWKIKDKNTVEKIQNIFLQNIPKTYIADGHHRVSTGILLNHTKGNSATQFGDLLSIYFSFNNLYIYDYNRVVSILREISPTELIARLSKYFLIDVIKELRKPTEKHEIICSMLQENYSLKWRKKFRKSLSDDQVILDARLLNHYIFNDIMGIKDVRNDSRISYIGGVDGVAGMHKLLLKDAHSVGFLLYPVLEKELIKIADAGKTLPPKSTWFEPRIKNAILAQEFK